MSTNQQIKSAIRKKILGFVSESEDKLNSALANFLFKNEFDFNKFKSEAAMLKEKFGALKSEQRRPAMEEAGVFARLQKLSGEIASFEGKARDFRTAWDMASNFKIDMRFDEQKLLDLIILETKCQGVTPGKVEMDQTQLLSESLSKCSYKEELFKQMSATSSDQLVETVNKIIELPPISRPSPPPETNKFEVKTPQNDTKSQPRTLFNSSKRATPSSFVSRPQSSNELKNGGRQPELGRSAQTSSRPSFISIEKTTPIIDSKPSETTTSCSKNSFFKHEPRRERDPNLPLTLDRKTIGIYKSLSSLSKHSSPRLTKEDKLKGDMSPPPSVAPQTPFKLPPKGSAACVSNLEIDSTKMRKIIFTLINARERVDRINFRNNSFICEPVSLLSEIFKIRCEYPLIIDFSTDSPCDRVTMTDRDRLELRKLNVEVII